MSPIHSIHPMDCRCTCCSPRRPLSGWPLAIAITLGGVAGIVIDLTGHTPAIAAALGMMS